MPVCPAPPRLLCSSSCSALDDFQFGYCFQEVLEAGPGRGGLFHLLVCSFEPGVNLKRPAVDLFGRHEVYVKKLWAVHEYSGPLQVIPGAIDAAISANHGGCMEREPRPWNGVWQALAEPVYVQIILPEVLNLKLIFLGFEGLGGFCHRTGCLGLSCSFVLCICLFLVGLLVRQAPVLREWLQAAEHGNGLSAGATRRTDQCTRIRNPT